LTNALNNVQTGDVIILQDNIATEGKVTTLRADSRDLDFTLDLNGFAITDRLDLRSTNVDNKESGYSLKVTVKNGTVGAADESVYYGILLAGGNVDVTLYEVESLGYYGGIYENGSWSGSSVTAEKCTFKGSDTAFGAYLPGGHTSTFTDCTFEGSVGVYVKSGNKTFNNCTITGNGEYIAPSYNGNGADGSGSGLVVDSTVGYNQPMTVTVNGGSISSVNGYAVEEVSNAAAGVDKVCYSTVTLDNVALSGKIENVYSENGVVKSIEDDKTVNYVSSETAINNVAPYVGDGEYIVLTGDIVSTNESNNLLLHSAYGAKNYTLDLNGHRLNAEVYAMASHSKGDYETLNITIMDSSAEEGQPGKGLIGSDVENMYGIIPQGNSNMTVTLKNLNVTGEWAFYTNGIYSGATITAEDCVFVTNPLDPGFGAYLASNHNVTFTNCTFEGNAGVYIKSGNTTFNNCTIAGNGVYEKPSYNGNGADGSGSGLVVDSTVGYQSPMVVTVNGGSITSVNGYAVEELSNAAEGVDKVCYSKVTVKGGTALVSGALGDVYSENGVVTVLCECGAQCVRQLTTLPTATQAGVQQYVCPVCGKVYGGKSVAALPEGGIYASIDGGDFFEIGFVTDLDSERVGDSDIILGLNGKQTLTIYNVPCADAETLLNEGFEFNSAWFEINEGERVMNDDYTYVYDNTVRVDLLEGAADKGASANKAITINLADYPDLSFITYFYDVAKDGGSYLSMGYIEIDMTSSVNVIAAV